MVERNNKKNVKNQINKTKPRFWAGFLEKYLQNSIFHFILVLRVLDPALN